MRSAPEQKLPPAPVTIATRMSGFWSISSQASYIRTSISELERVLLGRPVQGDDGDVALALEQQVRLFGVSSGMGSSSSRDRVGSDVVGAEQGVAAAVGEQHRAVDVRRVGAEQERHRAGDLGRARPPDRSGSGSRSTYWPSSASSRVPWSSGVLIGPGRHQVEPHAGLAPGLHPLAGGQAQRHAWSWRRPSGRACRRWPRGRAASSPATMRSSSVGSGIGVIEIEFEQISTAAGRVPGLQRREQPVEHLHGAEVVDRHDQRPGRRPGARARRRGRARRCDRR